MFVALQTDTACCGQSVRSLVHARRHTGAADEPRRPEGQTPLSSLNNSLTFLDVLGSLWVKCQPAIRTKVSALRPLDESPLCDKECVASSDSTACAGGHGNQCRENNGPGARALPVRDGVPHPLHVDCLVLRAVPKARSDVLPLLTNLGFHRNWCCGCIEVIPACFEKKLDTLPRMHLSRQVASPQVLKSKMDQKPKSPSQANPPTSLEKTRRDSRTHKTDVHDLSNDFEQGFFFFGDTASSLASGCS